MTFSDENAFGVLIGYHAIEDDEYALEPADFAHVLVAVGFGFRYLTPVGPIRVDLGRRLQVGRPPTLFKVGAGGQIVSEPYQVDSSCFGLGGSGGSVVTDNLCVLHLSIGEAF